LTKDQWEQVIEIKTRHKQEMNELYESFKQETVAA
jgi:hypothetical protein